MPNPQRNLYKAALVLVTSDTCNDRQDLDASGPIVVDRLENLNLFERVDRIIVPDEQQVIKDTIKNYIAQSDPALIITVGGTGLSPRDVTPEATKSLYDKECSGIAAALYYYGLRRSPFAALTCLSSGIVGRCLIVNFPGGVKACKECSDCLKNFIQHSLELIRSDHEAVKLTHQKYNSSSSASADTVTNKTNIVDSTTSANQEAQTESMLNLSSNESVNEERTSTCELTPADSSTISPGPSSDSGTRTPVEADSTLKGSSETERVLLTSSPYPLIDHSDALDIMGTLSYSLLGTKVKILLNTREEAYTSLGCVLSEDLQVKELSPKYDVSTMDGYVLDIPARFKEIIGKHLKTVQAIELKDLDTFVEYRQREPKPEAFFCYQVNTGGRLPDKDYAIVPVEQTGRRTASGVFLNNIEVGKYIRKAASDLNTSDIIKAGTLIGPVELSIIMTMGHRDIEVFRRPTLGLISTGDEIIDFFSSDSGDQDKVYDTNGPLLASFFKTRGFEVNCYGIVKDDPKQLLSKMSTGTRECDVLILTGGASMGSKDHVKDVIEQMGGIIHFGRVNIKPGKPAAFSSLMVDDKRKFIFSLPGNPVSAYITNLVLVVPFLFHGIGGHLQRDGPRLDLHCIGDMVPVKIDKLLDEEQSYTFDGRLEFARAKISGSPAKYGEPFPVTVSFRQQSSRMLSLKDFDCLIVIEPTMKGSKFTLGHTYQALKLNTKFI